MNRKGYFMRERVKRVFKNYYFLSFILGAITYFMFLSYSQMVGGKYILLSGDSLDGVVPGYWTLCDNILKGKGICYTWCSGLGINSYINLASGMLFNISMPFYLLLHNVDYTMVTVLILVVKAGITSLFFYLYVDKIWNVRGINALAFSVSYAMCAYWVVYIPFMLTYADAVYMLPLILFYVSRFAAEGKYKMMCFAYFYLFLNFYYTGYMVGFFSLFYLVFYMVLINRYSIMTVVKKLMHFGICILITAGMTAVILYPTGYFLLTKYVPDAQEGEFILEANIFDIYSQLFIGQVAGTHTVLPYVYCGLPVLFLVPFFFLAKEIKRNEKLLSGILFAMMIISCLVVPLYLFWHCMDVPDWDPYRFSFIISFLLCFMAMRASKYIFEKKRVMMPVLVVLNSGIYIVYMFVQPLYQKEYLVYPNNTWKYFGINLFFMSCYVAWYWIYVTYRTKKNTSAGMKILPVFILAIELVVNGYSGYYKENRLNPENSEDTYYLWKNTVNDTLKIIENDDSGFYRISSKDDYIMNAPLFFNYAGVATFTNMENYEVRRALGRLGLLTSPKVILCNGMTDFTKMLLAVRYEIQNVNMDRRDSYVVDSGLQADVAENEYNLALGFLVDESIRDFQFPGQNQFENINELAQCITGKEHILYDTNITSAELVEDGVCVVPTEAGNYALTLCDEANGVGVIHFRVPKEERKAYIQFDFGSSVIDKKAPFLVDARTWDSDWNERLTTSFVKEMTEVGEAYDVTVLMTDDLYSAVRMPDVYLAYYNETEFLKVYDELKKGQMDVVEYDNGYVHGTIDVLEDHKVLFTSIPYDEGWEITVNGEKKEPLALLDGAFMGLELEKGNHDIVFQYHVPGLKNGAVISAASFLMLLILFGIDPKFKVIVRPAHVQENQENRQ
ncbi:MAG: YfhO family protein [Lachnospiraceae bacterium]|nr:YfhO family protein [Lachnospiraceae bacterium]